MSKFYQMWLSSYHKDPIAFLFEQISLIFTVTSSLYLAMHADAPNMLIVYPGFFVGSLSAMIAYWRREIPTPMMVTSYFAVVNIFGFGRAAGWW
jgi:hypothetical protein